MRRARCPHCNNVNVIADDEWGQLTQCEGPRCRRIFMAGGLSSEQDDDPSPPTPSPPRPAPRAAPATVFPPPMPLLTGPHICRDCQGRIDRALGRRRATIVHRPASRQVLQAATNCRMDIYAAIYLCPNPRCQTLLETPSYQWDQWINCPSCAISFEAPRDDVLHEHEGDAREGVAFHFRCPSCDFALRCDSTRLGRPIMGQRVACLRCRQIIEVPSAGAGAGGQGPTGYDPREAVQQGLLHRCSNPACGRMIPARAEMCPLCGEPQ